MKAFKLFPLGAYPFLKPDEKLFVKQCRIDTYTASGPGGQKRNRTYSAVRITHYETGLSVIAEESRSQAENRQKAIRRLKKSIALEIRSQGPEIPWGIRKIFQKDNLNLNRKNLLYPVFCAMVLDCIYMAKGKTADSSNLLDITTGKLNKLLSKDHELLNAANCLREHFQLKPLRKS